MPVTPIAHEQTNVPISTLELLPDGLRLDASYQRDSVWTDEQRRALIYSILAKESYGVICTNRRAYDPNIEGDPIYVVDGKQRLLTITGFLNDEFSVPTEWFADEETEASDHPSLQPGVPLDGEVFYSQLAETGRGRFKRNMVPFHEYSLPTEEEEKKRYLRVNTAGTAHTQAELDKAR